MGKCHNPESKQQFKTITECQKHQKYHCRKKNQNTLLNKLTISKTDRRTIQGIGTPQENETRYQNRIEYNTKANKWVCKTRNRNMICEINKMQYNTHSSTSKRKLGKTKKWKPKK